jgi:dihydrofolate reductase
MRRIRYRMAMSLEGYISGPKGEIDWITSDPGIDFGAIMNEFDTLLVGRRTFDMMAQAKRTTMPGMGTFVFFPHTAAIGSSRSHRGQRRPNGNAGLSSRATR